MTDDECLLWIGLWPMVVPSRLRGFTKTYKDVAKTALMLQTRYRDMKSANHVSFYFLLRSLRPRRKCLALLLIVAFVARVMTQENRFESPREITLEYSRLTNTAKIIPNEWNPRWECKDFIPVESSTPQGCWPCWRCNRIIRMVPIHLGIRWSSPWIQSLLRFWEALWMTDI